MWLSNEYETQLIHFERYVLLHCMYDGAAWRECVFIVSVILMHAFVCLVGIRRQPHVP